MKIQPKLTLIGAGPGNPELITIKGLKALSKAAIVLYDALVNPELLEFAPDTAIKLFVGKRKANHSHTQDEINKLIVDSAFQYGSVVRLKGGDPFVFGRGFEELQHAEKFGIETEFIPGISSSISVPGLQGIPVTNRGVSESFWVLTGTTSSGEMSKDIATAAATNATVVILMGTEKLTEIVEVYKNNNKHQLAIAVIQNGSLPNEKIAIGTIDTIVNNVAKQNIASPAVIVIGEVVALHSQFSKWEVNFNQLLKFQN